MYQGVQTADQTDTVQTPWPPSLGFHMQVLGLADRTAANNFMVQNPNRVIGAVHFDVTSAEAVGYTLQTNSTV